MEHGQLSDLTDDQIRDLPWYYQIELRPGAVTAGKSRGSLSLTRSQIDAMEVAGQSCLDIGTQEGVISTLLSNRGARHVVAYDRLDLSDRIDLVKQAYGAEFDYVHSKQLHELPGELTARGMGAFDVVVFAGVLYHMIDPLGGLGLVRGMVRHNGLLLLETSAICSDDMVMHFNNGGRYFPGSNYFQVTTAALDYFLRMLRLQVVDCQHWGMSKGVAGRVSLMCRAVDAPLADPEDDWMTGHWIANDFRAVSLDFDPLQSDQPPVAYKVTNPKLSFHPKVESVDITRTVKSTKPFKEVEETSRLSLSLVASS